MREHAGSAHSSNTHSIAKTRSLTRRARRVARSDFGFWPFGRDVLKRENPFAYANGSPFGTACVSMRVRRPDPVETNDERSDVDWLRE